MAYNETMKEYREEDQILKQVKKIHMIGIGGSGMCPLAEILHSKGYEITGSDNNESDPLKKVRQFAKVTLGHDAKNLGDAQLVVYSAAISADNCERQEAIRRGIPLMERSHLLGALTRLFDNVIGVCGTHGKTTVTSMLTQVLIQCGCNPNAVIGGKLPLINHYGLVGDSETLVVESCEFVDTFLQLSEDVAILLNIDNDHLDYFKTMENMIASFHKFCSKAKTVLVNGDDANSLKAVQDIQGQIITFGLSKQNDYYADGLQVGKFGYGFDVYHQNQRLGRVELSIPGKHNIYNGLAVYAIAHEMGLANDDVVQSIKAFKGATRRFEFIGDYGFMLADDYGHHPTEIEATIKAAKELDYNRVVVVFQPFTFSRTKMLKEEFARVLDLADEIVMTPIMGSREVNTFNIYSEDVAVLMKKPVHIINTFEEIKDYILKTCKKGELVITMGCGDIYKVAHLISEEMENK